MNAKLTADTEVDLLRGINWFDMIALGLGDQFESEFYDAVGRVKQNPELFAPNHTGDFIVVVGLFTSGEDETVLQNRG